MSRIGFLGIGRMGRPMAANLAAAGHALRIWNRTRATSDAFADGHRGIVVADDPAQAARTSEIVITMLADDHAVRAAWLGSDAGPGLLDGIEPGAIAIDMGTTRPSLARELHAAGQRRGVEVLDVPVSGSTAAAEAASLTLIAGGEAATVERARPVLERLGTPLVHVGSAGSGSAMKLAVNTVIHSLNQALAEALLLAERSGISRRDAYAVLEASAAAAPMLAYRKAQYLEQGDAPVSFALALACKDVRLALELGTSTGASMPQARANLDVLQRAVAAGLGDADMAAVVPYMVGYAETREGDGA